MRGLLASFQSWLSESVVSPRTDLYVGSGHSEAKNESRRGKTNTSHLGNPVGSFHCGPETCINLSIVLSSFIVRAGVVWS